MTGSEPSWSERLQAGAAALLGRKLIALEVERFTRYLALLQSWQRVHRLIGSMDPAWIVDHVFVDSLVFVAALPAEVTDVLDLGSGAGIPGIPLRIVSSSVRLTMIEARARRVSFLRTVVRELALTDVVVIGARAEAVADETRSRFDAVVARCAGPVGEVVALGRTFVRPGGVILVSTGPDRKVPAGAERVIVQDGSTTGRTLLAFRPAAWRPNPPTG